jgi:hypothetical protein
MSVYSKDKKEYSGVKMTSRYDEKLDLLTFNVENIK